jgi:hypothetical protein
MQSGEPTTAFVKRRGVGVQVPSRALTLFLWAIVASGYGHALQIPAGTPPGSSVGTHRWFAGHSTSPRQSWAPQATPQSLSICGSDPAELLVSAQQMAPPLHAAVPRQRYLYDVLPGQTFLHWGPGAKQQKFAPSWHVLVPQVMFGSVTLPE